jgi:hypothetical protein
MRKSRSLLVKTGTIAVGIAAIAAMSVTAALAAPHAPAPHAPAHAAATRVKASPDGAFTNCPNGDWCIFTGLDGTGSRLAHSTTWPHMPVFRSTDESFANRTSGLVRFYYHPSYGGAYVCVDSGAYANDAYYYAFYEGGTGVSTATGIGITVYREIASVGVARGGCSNPLPLP